MQVRAEREGGCEIRKDRHASRNTGMRGLVRVNGEGVACNDGKGRKGAGLEEADDV